MAVVQGAPDVVLRRPMVAASRRRLARAVSPESIIRDNDVSALLDSYDLCVGCRAPRVDEPTASAARDEPRRAMVNAQDIGSLSLQYVEQCHHALRQRISALEREAAGAGARVRVLSERRRRADDAVRRLAARDADLAAEEARLEQALDDAHAEGLRMSGVYISRRGSPYQSRRQDRHRGYGRSGAFDDASPSASSAAASSISSSDHASPRRRGQRDAFESASGEHSRRRDSHSHRRSGSRSHRRPRSQDQPGTMLRTLASDPSSARGTLGRNGSADGSYDVPGLRPPSDEPPRGDAEGQRGPAASAAATAALPPPPQRGSHAEPVGPAPASAGPDDADVVLEDVPSGADSNDDPMRI